MSEMTPPQAGAPPAGWYHDGTAMRWWDGSAWGPQAPGSSPTWPASDPAQDGATMAVLSHVGFFFAAVILALVLRLTEGKKNDFVKHHATEALNFQLTFLIVWIGGIFALMATTVTATTNDVVGPGLGPGVVVGFFLVLPAVFIGGAVFSVIAAVRAGRGEWYRYPICIRFVRGARPST